jgi:hypothetical protein
MKGKTILISGLALFMLLTFVAPVSAGSPNKTPITCDDLHTAGYSSYPDVRVTNGGISHIDNFEFYGTIDIKLNGVLLFDDVPWVDIATGTYNSKTMQAVLQFDEVWTLPGGTFEGVAHITLEGGNLQTYKEMYSHIVLHGTGDYEGQILSMSLGYTRGVTPAVYEGYWLKP